MNKDQKKIDNQILKGKTLLLRVDLNVPVIDGKVQDDTRIKSVIPSIKHIINKGGNVDSFKRYIYIHGTHEEGLIGEKASHGCIRMLNHDVLELYELIPEETTVNIYL